MSTISVELRQKLEDSAKSNKVLILSFIAPENAIKVSPSSYSYASIGSRDMYSLEEKIEKLKNDQKLPKKLHLIIQTPGGNLSTSYKIALYLRNNFKDIHVFVPYEAASGGTMLCLASNKITMSELGNLTPIDPQIMSSGFKRTSACRLLDAVNDFQKKFGETHPSDIPSPWQQMAEKFDPILYAEMNAAILQSFSYASKLLKKSGYSEEEASKIAYGLARTSFTHEHCIDAKEAEEMGIKIDNSRPNLELLSLYKEYLSIVLKEKVDYHIIEHFVEKEIPESPTE